MRDQDIVRLVGQCLDAGMTTREAAVALKIPYWVSERAGWAYRHPDNYRRWREEQNERQRKERRQRGAKERDTFWTPERISQIRALRAIGESFRDCAAKIGHDCTRNMVAGICNRIGISASRKPGPTAMDKVMEGIAAGLTRKEIIERYEINAHTVQVYAWRIRVAQKAVDGGANAT